MNGQLRKFNNLNLKPTLFCIFFVPHDENLKIWSQLYDTPNTHSYVDPCNHHGMHVSKDIFNGRGTPHPHKKSISSLQRYVTANNMAECCMESRNNFSLYCEIVWLHKCTIQAHSPHLRSLSSFPFSWWFDSCRTVLSLQLTHLKL